MSNPLMARSNGACMAAVIGFQRPRWRAYRLQVADWQAIRQTLERESSPSRNSVQLLYPILWWSPRFCPAICAPYLLAPICSRLGIPSACRPLQAATLAAWNLRERQRPLWLTGFPIRNAGIHHGKQSRGNSWHHDFSGFRDGGDSAGPTRGVLRHRGLTLGWTRTFKVPRLKEAHLPVACYHAPLAPGLFSFGRNGSAQLQVDPLATCQPALGRTLDWACQQWSRHSCLDCIRPSRAECWPCSNKS